MKRRSFYEISLIIFLFLAFSCSKFLKIENPVYLSSNTEHLTISRIESNDTATVLYMNAYNLTNRPVILHSGTYLKGNDTGKQYRLLSSENFQLDSAVLMPVNGNVPFILFFEPMDKKENSFDFVEYPGEKPVQIAGVLLKEPKTKIKMILKGTVLNRPYSSRLILAPVLGDLNADPWFSIPVQNGKFEYAFYTDEEDVYELTFYDEYKRTLWESIPFVVENGVVDFTLYSPIEWDRSQGNSTGILSQEKRRIYTVLDSIFDYRALSEEYQSLITTEEYFSDAAKLLLKKIKREETGPVQHKFNMELSELMKMPEGYSSAGLAFNQKRDQMALDVDMWRLDYAQNNFSLVGYFLLLDLFTESKDSEEIDITPYIAVFREIYEPKYPDHPLTKRIRQFISIRHFE